MSSSSQVVESWISSFCSLLGHEFFAEVSEDFIEDDFNLTGLSSQVHLYKEALEMILDVEPEEDDEDEDEDDDDDDDVDILDDNNRPIGYRRNDRRQTRLQNNVQVIEESAETLYGLIHQRYITSRPGLTQMHEKYEQGHFGLCPRVYCRGTRVLPVGISDVPGMETVKLFCPCCLDVYTPPNSRFQSVDGAFFGTTFGCLFLMSFPELQVGSQREALSPSPAAGTDDATSITSRTESHLSPQSTNSPTAIRRPNARSDIPQPIEINGVQTQNFAPSLGTGQIYEPRIYGFRINERAKSGPRMKWLRMKPDDVRELDEVKRYELLQARNQSDRMIDDGEAADEDIEEDAEDDAEVEMENGHGVELAQPAQTTDPTTAIDHRKKAPLKRRVRRPDDQMMTPSQPIDINGGVIQR